MAHARGAERAGPGTVLTARSVFTCARPAWQLTSSGSLQLLSAVLPLLKAWLRALGLAQVLPLLKAWLRALGLSAVLPLLKAWLRALGLSAVLPLLKAWLRALGLAHVLPLPVQLLVGAAGSPHSLPLPLMAGASSQGLSAACWQQAAVQHR